MSQFQSRGRRITVAASGTVAAMILPLASLAPMAQAATGAAGTETAPSTTSPVAKSSTGSYIVRHEGRPARPVGQAARTSTRHHAKQRKAAIRTTHDKVLKGAGVSTTRKTTDYSNAAQRLRGAHRPRRRRAARQATPASPWSSPTRCVRPTVHRRSDGADGQAEHRGGQRPQHLPRADRQGRRLRQRASPVRASSSASSTPASGPSTRCFADDGTLPGSARPSTSERSACAFGNTAWNANDKPFTCNNKLVGAREFLDTYKANTGLEPYEFDSARDNEGHGTHTASTAAGNANVRAKIFGVNKGVVSGIAPRAQVIAYKALGDARRLHLRPVRLRSTRPSPTASTSSTTRSVAAPRPSAPTRSRFLFAADAGVFTAVSAGNDGPGAETIGGPADVPWVTGVGATTLPDLLQGHRSSSATARSTSAASVTKGTADAPSHRRGQGRPAPAGRPRPVHRGHPRPGQGHRQDRPLRARHQRPHRQELRGQACRRCRHGPLQPVDVDTMFTDNFFVPTVMIDNTPGEEIRDWVNSPGHPDGPARRTTASTSSPLLQPRR